MIVRKSALSLKICCYRHPLLLLNAEQKDRSSIPKSRAICQVQVIVLTY
jgi:hypothetical protein